MNLQVTIPQIFYDLIARVMPGFFFLKTWEIVFSCEVPVFQDSANNWAAVTFTGVAFIAICYLIGWLLSTPAAFKKSEERPPTKEERAHSKLRESQTEKEDASLDSEDPLKWKTYQKYDWIRLVDNQTGFRIVKLRAEHRMLTSSLTGTGILLLALILSSFGGYFKNQEGAFELNLFLPRLLILAIILVAFAILARKMKKQYQRSIEQHFWLLQWKQREKKRENDL